MRANILPLGTEYQPREVEATMATGSTDMGNGQAPTPFPRCSDVLDWTRTSLHLRLLFLALLLFAVLCCVCWAHAVALLLCACSLLDCRTRAGSQPEC